MEEVNNRLLKSFNQSFAGEMNDDSEPIWMYTDSEETVNVSLISSVCENDDDDDEDQCFFTLPCVLTLYYTLTHLISP